MIIQKYESQKVGRDLLIHWNKILKQERKYPLDYLLNQPKENNFNENAQVEKRRNSIKNVIMRIIIEIREGKEKPKLSDLIAASKQQQ